MDELRIDRGFVTGFGDKCTCVGNEGNVQQSRAYDKRILDSDLL